MRSWIRGAKAILKPEAREAAPPLPAAIIAPTPAEASFEEALPAAPPAPIPQYREGGAKTPIGLVEPSSLLELIDTSPGQALILVDTDGNIRTWNTGAAQLFGYARDEAMGQPLQKFVYIEPSQRYHYDDMLWRVRASDARVELSRFILCDDGRFLPALVTLQAMHDIEGAIVGYGVSVRFDNGGTEIERDYRDSLALMNTIVETLQDPLFVKDRQGRYLLINAAFAMHTGKATQDILGRTDRELLPAELHEIAEQTDHRVITTRAPQEYEYTRGSNALQRTKQVHKIPFYNAVGGVCGVLGIVRDNTQRRRQELEKDRLFMREKSARQDAESMVRRLEAIQSIFDPKLTTMQPQALIAELLDRIKALLRADVATICLLGENKRELVHCQSRGAATDDDWRVTVKVGEGLIGRIASENRPVIVADRRELEVGNLFDHSAIRSFIGSPLSLDGRLLGVLYLGSRTPNIFSKEDLHILHLVANRAASTMERGRLFEELHEANAAMHRLSQRMLEVQEEERRHLSRELHDEIGQILTGIKLHLQSSPVNAGSGDAAKHVQVACDYVDEAIAQVRRLSTGLRPPALDVLGLEAALKESVQRLTTMAGIQDVIQAKGLGRFDHDIEIALFRVAQEAVTNVVRHSRARAVQVSVWRQPKEMVLTVVDDGIGFDSAAAHQASEAGRSFGLRSMQERTMLMGGSFEVKSRPGKGTTVKATFPLTDETPEEFIEHRLFEVPQEPDIIEEPIAATVEPLAGDNE